ncbi:MAG: BNR-4 repeat-containing protein [Sulfitobacter sp.]
MGIHLGINLENYRNGTGGAPVPSGGSYFSQSGATNPWYALATSPNAVYDSAVTTTWIAWQTHDRQIEDRFTRLIGYNHTTSEWTKVYAVDRGLGVKNDDHGVPSVTINGDGRIVVFWGTHNADIIIRTSLNAHDPSGFSRASISGNYTYPHPVMQASGRLDFFVRNEDFTPREMPLKYRPITFSGSTPTIGVEEEVCNFGFDTRFYQGNAILRSDGFIWQVATRSNFGDGHRRDVYMFRHDPDNSRSLAMDGTIMAWPIDLATANANARIYEHAVDFSDTSTTIPQMAEDTNGNLHVTFSIGRKASGGATTMTAYHAYIPSGGTAATASTSIATLDFWLETLMPVARANGSVDLYYCGTDRVRGGSIYRRNVPSGDDGSGVGAAELIQEVETGRPNLEQSAMVFDAHPDLRVIWSEVATSASDSGATNKRLYAYGDSGPVLFTPPASVAMPSGSLFAFDFTDPANFSANNDGTGAITVTDQEVERVTDLSGNGNHLTWDATTAQRGQYRDDDGKGYLAIGQFNSGALSSSRFSTPAINLYNGGQGVFCFALRLMGAFGVYHIMDIDDNASDRVTNIRFDASARLIAVNIQPANTNIFSPSELVMPSEDVVITLVSGGYVTGTDLRINGEFMSNHATTLASLSEELFIGGRKNGTGTCANRHSAMFGRSGAVTLAEVEEIEAWVRSKQN